jgi:hypothetical protein
MDDLLGGAENTDVDTRDCTPRANPVTPYTDAPFWYASPQAGPMRKSFLTLFSKKERLRFLPGRQSPNPCGAEITC